MIPTSISATAMQTATLCLARYAAENIKKNRGGSSAPASLGSACHNALEQYVTSCHIEKTQKPELQFLLDLFKMQFMVLFNTADAQGPEYEDGVAMLTKWHERTVFDDTWQVHSVEVKSHFDVHAVDNTGQRHSVPFNYIWDRCDVLNETTVRVVDYKTWRMGIQPEDLIDKLQARAYALAAQIQFPHAEKIWVVFDQLRYDTVGVVFSKDDNIATWKFLRKHLKIILDTPEEDAPETINSDCRWCIRKTTCKTLAKNVAAGGVAGLTVAQMIDRRAAIEAQMQGLTWAANELDSELRNVAKESDIETLSSEHNKVYWTRSGRRSIDRTDVLEKILGNEIWSRVGKTSVTMSTIDKLLKGSDLTNEQKAQVKGLIVQNYGEPSLKTKPVNKIDGA